MAALNLVTGYQGVAHVTAPQWADLNRGIIGDAAILPVGSEMQPTIQTANQITVPDGVVVYDGREFYIGYGESVNLAIASGTQGMLRNDIVVVEYNRDESSGVESAQFQVIEGTPVASNPQDPAYSDQDIRTGVFTSQKPFCRVLINGTAIQEIQMLVDISDSIEKLMQYISNLEEENTALNSALEYERITGSNYYLCRIGDVKFYNYSGAIPEKWTGNQQFQMREALPVAFRPKNAVATGVVLRSGVTGILDISTSGIIKLNPSEDIPQGNWVMFSICYI